MQEKRYKKILRIASAVCVILAVFVLGAFAGTTKTIANIIAPTHAVTVDGTPAANTNLDEFWQVWNLVQNKYPFKQPASQDKVYGAISGMVSSYGDPYTTFFPPQQAKLFNDQVTGSFGGVGMEVGVKDGYLVVIAPLKDSPAAQAGILAGDIIATVDGKKTDGQAVDAVISQIRGEVGTKVTIGVIHPKTTAIVPITITRQIVNAPTIDTKKVGDVFDISLYAFTQNSADLFKSALQDFVASGDKKLIIDLRNNPGGYLDSAVDIASYFLPNGATIVSENSGSPSSEIIHQSKGFTLLANKPQVVILVNGGSASASEILAGALSEQGVAQLVGTQTFGKGSVQEVMPLPDGSAVKITVAKWYTPKGISISEKGITPGTIVENNPVKNPKTGNYSDPQLDAAVKLLDSTK